MNIESAIIKKFKLVKNAFFESENNISFLRVEVNLHDLSKLLDYSKEINKFVDKHDNNDKKYYLDIYSSGTEIEIDKHSLQKYLDENILVKLKKEIKGMNTFEGQLLEDSKEFILLKWNAKGQFRKQTIEKDNISNINLSAKIKKIKKVKNEKRRI